MEVNSSLAETSAGVPDSAQVDAEPAPFETTLDVCAVETLLEIMATESELLENETVSDYLMIEATAEDQDGASGDQGELGAETTPGTGQLGETEVPRAGSSTTQAPPCLSLTAESDQGRVDGTQPVSFVRRIELPRAKLRELVRGKTQRPTTSAATSRSSVVRPSRPKGHFHRGERAREDLRQCLERWRTRPHTDRDRAGRREERPQGGREGNRSRPRETHQNQTRSVRPVRPATFRVRVERTPPPPRRSVTAQDERGRPLRPQDLLRVPEAMRRGAQEHLTGRQKRNRRYRVWHADGTFTRVRPHQMSSVDPAGGRGDRQ